MTKELQKTLKSYGQDRDSLIPILQSVQEKFGYVSEQSVTGIASYLNISESTIYGVATFYTQFRFTRPGDHIIRVCQGTACHVRGAQRIMNEVVKHLGIKPGETTPDYKFSLERVACFGSCALSPVVVADNRVYGRMTAQKTKQVLKEME
jgi:NADH:ubiquinone oxidoreductase subunit E